MILSSPAITQNRRDEVAGRLGSDIAIGDDLKHLAGNDHGAAIAAVDTGGEWSNWLANGVNAAKPTLDSREAEESRQTSHRLTPGELNGERITLISNGDIRLVAGQLLGRQGVSLTAVGDIDLAAGDESQTTYQESQRSGHGFSTVETDGRLHMAGPNYNQDEAGRNTSDARSQASRILSEYNADLYAVLAPRNNGLYVTAKFGNEWLAIGSTKRVFTDYVGSNGIQNRTHYAPGLIGAHVNSVNASAGLYTLYYTPTHGFLMDGLLTFADKLGFTTSDARNLATVLEDVQASGRQVTWVAHSRGGVTFAEAARVAQGDLSNNWVVFHSGANNREVTEGILGDRRIRLGDQERQGVIFYRDSPYDAVPNIIGLNGSPLDIVKSIIASPLLFAGPEWSPHTMPYQASPPSSPSQPGVPPPLSFSLLGSSP